MKKPSSRSTPPTKSKKRAPLAKGQSSDERKQYKVVIFVGEEEKIIGMCPLHYRPVRVSKTKWKVCQGPADVKGNLDRRGAARLAQRLNTL